MPDFWVCAAEPVPAHTQKSDLFYYSDNFYVLRNLVKRSILILSPVRLPAYNGVGRLF
jgi:hypothetical protein